MAGGRGARLKMGEKGLVRLCGNPLIDYVLTVLEEVGIEPIVVTTPRTPYTANYCRVRGIDQICTEGIGYIEDIREVITTVGENGPVLILCADIPGIRIHHLTYLFSRYQNEEVEACSVWVPAKYSLGRGSEVPYCQDIGGVSAVPAGLNILLGEKVDSVQTEISVLIDDPALTFNINTPAELKDAEAFFSLTKDQSAPQNGLL